MELSTRRIVNWWNGGVVESLNRRMGKGWNGGVIGVVKSPIRRMVELVELSNP